MGDESTDFKACIPLPHQGIVTHRFPKGYPSEGEPDSRYSGSAEKIVYYFTMLRCPRGRSTKEGEWRGRGTLRLQPGRPRVRRKDGMDFNPPPGRGGILSPAAEGDGLATGGVEHSLINHSFIWYLQTSTVFLSFVNLPNGRSFPGWGVDILGLDQSAFVEAYVPPSPFVLLTRRLRKENGRGASDCTCQKNADRQPVYARMPVKRRDGGGLRPKRSGEARGGAHREDLVQFSKKRASNR